MVNDAGQLPDFDGVLMALAALPESQREELAQAYLTFACQVADAGDHRLARAYFGLAQVVAHSTDLAGPAAALADQLARVAAKYPPLFLPN